MIQKQTLLTFTQYLNATDIHHFYNIDELLYKKLQHPKIHAQAVSLFMFNFYLKTMGSYNSIV